MASDGPSGAANERPRGDSFRGGRGRGRGRGRGDSQSRGNEPRSLPHNTGRRGGGGRGGISSPQKQPQVKVEPQPAAADGKGEEEEVEAETPAPFVIFTDDATKRFEDYADSDIANTDQNIGIRYENTDIEEDTRLLLRYNCPDADCDVACLGWPDLHRHVRGAHHRKICDLCSRHKKVFTHEQDLFTDAELGKHMKQGDDNPGAIDQSGFKGHPLCRFCGERFYGADELYVHCREKHERCFLCDRREGNSQPNYYANYDTLSAHFRKDHFMCSDRECLEKKFIVFDSEMDLKAHQLEEHGNSLSKDVRRDARVVDISSFDYRAPYVQERRGGGSQREQREGRGRGRGRDPNAEPIPASSAQPLRRDEQAFQRQMAIQSAQSVTPRTFGGQLTSTPTPGPSRAPPGTRQTASNTVPQPSSSVDSVSEAVRNVDISQGNLTPQEQARQLRHRVVIERASTLLQNDQTKLQQFRNSISFFQTGALSAPALIDSFFALFSDTTSSALGTLIREIADLYEEKAKADSIRTAWNDWRAINEDYPSLPGPSSTSGGSIPLGWASITSATPSSSSAAPPKPKSTRVLKLKSSTAQSSRSSVSQTRSWGTASGLASSSNPFPGLPPPSGDTCYPVRLNITNTIYNVPNSTTQHGNEHILCLPITKDSWPSVAAIIIFFATNYLAHAATVKSSPGDDSLVQACNAIMALFFPMSGLLRALNAIIRFPMSARNEVDKACRAGALCMVVRAPHWRPKPGQEFDVGVVPENNDDKMKIEEPERQPERGASLIEANLITYLPSYARENSSKWVHFDSVWARSHVDLRLTRVHGTKDLPEGYEFAIVPRNTYLLSQVASNTEEDPRLSSEISAGYSILKAVASIIQVIAAFTTLLSHRPDLIKRWGYASYHLTVIPYLVMTFVNLICNMVSPDYPCLYMVRSETMVEAEGVGGRFEGEIAQMISLLPKDQVQFDDPAWSGVTEKGIQTFSNWITLTTTGIYSLSRLDPGFWRKKKMSAKNSKVVRLKVVSQLDSSPTEDPETDVAQNILPVDQSETQLPSDGTETQLPQNSLPMDGCQTQKRPQDVLAKTLDSTDEYQIQIPSAPQPSLGKSFLYTMRKNKQRLKANPSSSLRRAWMLYKLALKGILAPMGLDEGAEPIPVRTATIYYPNCQRFLRWDDFDAPPKTKTNEGESVAQQLKAPSPNSEMTTSGQRALAASISDIRTLLQLPARTTTSAASISELEDLLRPIAKTKTNPAAAHQQKEAL
ncbi:hypothetical protein G7Y89_g408 [Cudoniella acicularis]|uniref:C2H2-type domain-containing protein n=1 Tax=Cudoniella acicularis TaxID=354080 RepID=A0A8H4RY89_9HELO|nr:hypothetical protein G7Y89_g408 [Cudoniella acicularis]